MIRPLLLAALAGALLQPAVGSAQDLAPAPAHKPKKMLVLVSPAELDPRQILPPPPAEGSLQALADLAAIHQEMAGASPERLAQARFDDQHENLELLAPVLGARLDLKALPATTAVLTLVQTDAGALSSAAKKDFPRKRPWAADPSIHTCDPDDKPNGSYPSGHATLGYALGLTMARLMPDKAEDFMARARDYAMSRQLCGAHFPSDTQASEALATALVYALLAKPEFQAKLTAARAELARAASIPVR